MAEAAQTTDPAGIARAPTGEITAPPPPAQPSSSPSTTPAPTTTSPSSPSTEPAADGKDEQSLLNAAGKAPEGAPEAYSDYTVPEGYTLDPEIKTEAVKIFKGLNLTQAQAQQLVNFYTDKTLEALKAPFERFQETRKEWRATAESHPELRGKLSAGGEVLTTISKALDSLGDPTLASGFRQAMDQTGVGDNPDFIRAFYRWSQRLTEETHFAGRGPAPQGQQRPGTADVRTPAQDLWPNLPSIRGQ